DENGWLGQTITEQRPALAGEEAANEKPAAEAKDAVTSGDARAESAVEAHADAGATDGGGE
ncbi:MAG: hypothetical protein C4340_07250, partial [Armatimonadota bacterium]